MGLTDKREQMVKEMPNIKSEVRRSKDGKFIIHRTIVTHIKPVAYYEKVLEGDMALPEEDLGIEA